MMTGSLNQWEQWLRNGRLASLVAGVFFVAWLVAQVFWPADRDFPTEFTVLVMGMVGSAFTSVMLAATRKTEATDKKIEVLQDRNTDLEQRATTTEKRSADSERRESEWSLHKDHADPDDGDPTGRHHA